MKYNVVVYGLGTEFYRLYNSLKYLEVTQQISIIAVTAKSISAYTKLDGYPIISQSNLLVTSYDYLFVMSSKYFQEIRQELLSMGVPEDKILSCNILYYPNLCLDKYIALKQKNISIVSNNCWGGIAYNTLGLKCCSPFKNLFLMDDDYIRLISDFDYYMHQSPIFLRMEKEKHSGVTYPVLGLADVEIHCNHDTHADMAIRNWIRRKQYINYNQLFIEMYTTNEDVAQRFSELDMYNNKVCFVPFEKQSEWEMTLQMFPEQEEFWQVVNSSAGRGNNSYIYDLIDLLSGEKNYRVELS